jgi:hypothetical protein
MMSQTCIGAYKSIFGIRSAHSYGISQLPRLLKPAAEFHSCGGRLGYTEPGSTV